MEKLKLVPVQDSHIRQLTCWLNKEHVLKWYNDADEWLNEIKERKGNFSFLNHFIAQEENHPIGFGQYYDCFAAKEDWYTVDRPHELFSIDYFIGEEDYLRKGYGKQIIRLLVERIKTQYPHAKIIVQPDSDNIASCKALLGNGFVFAPKANYYTLDDTLKHCGTTVINTERLTLRPFQYTDDNDMLVYWISDPKIQSLYCEPVYVTKEEVRALLDKYINSYKNPDYYRWAIIQKESGICIGQVAIFLIDNKNHFCEIEYALGSKFHRKGYATEAVKAILNFCFNHVNFHKVQVCHKEGNIASQGVIRKCNFTYEGTLRDFFYTDGKYVDRLYYSMLKEEYDKDKFRSEQTGSVGTFNT